MDLPFRCPPYLIVNVGNYGRSGGQRKVRARAAWLIILWQKAKIERLFVL